MKIIDESMMTNDAERKMQYNEYLRQHIAGVQKSFNDYLLPVLQEDESLTNSQIVDIIDQIKDHDQSKYEDEEYPGYLQWFYPENGDESNKDQTQFDLAWNHHQHMNKHHWQHWICRSDNDDDVILDMDLASICEMICDWSSFQYLTDYDLSGTAHEWYKDHGKKMLLSDNTREIVEELLDKTNKQL